MDSELQISFQNKCYSGMTFFFKHYEKLTISQDALTLIFPTKKYNSEPILYNQLLKLSWGCGISFFCWDLQKRPKMCWIFDNRKNVDAPYNYQLSNYFQKICGTFLMTKKFGPMLRNGRLSNLPIESLKLKISIFPVKAFFNTPETY